MKNANIMYRVSDIHQFALSVVNGNPVPGDTHEEKAQRALELYLTAKKIADNHNEAVRSQMLEMPEFDLLPISDIKD